MFAVSYFEIIIIFRFVIPITELKDVDLIIFVYKGRSINKGRHLVSPILLLLPFASPASLITLAG